MPSAHLGTLFLAAYAAVSAIGLLFMKTAPSPLSSRFAGGFALYGVGFGLWYLMLRRLPLSVAFPLASGALAVATQVLAAVVLRERLSLVHAIGVGLVVVGGWLVSWQAR